MLQVGSDNLYRGEGLLMLLGQRCLEGVNWWPSGEGDESSGGFTGLVGGRKTGLTLVLLRVVWFGLMRVGLEQGWG